MVTTIYMVRHCQSQGNLNGRFQGRSDAEITEAGKKQLDLLSLRFRNKTIDVIYSSPLKRAMATAQAINRFHELPILEAEELLEIDVGELEDSPLSAVAGKYPELAYAWDNTVDLCCFPGGETMAQVYERTTGFLNRIAAENPGKICVLATHGGVIRCLYAYVKFGKPEGLRESTVFGNTGVSIIEADGQGRFTLKVANDLSHLPEGLGALPVPFRFTTEVV